MSSSFFSPSVDGLLIERPDYPNSPSTYYTELYYLKQAVLTYPLLNSLLNNVKNLMGQMPRKEKKSTT